MDNLLKNKKTAHQANGDEMPVSDNARHGRLLNYFTYGVELSLAC